MPKPAPPFEEMVKMRAVLRLPGMDKVQARRDLVYKQAGEQALTCDVFTPSGWPAPERYPAVVMIHGGPIPPGKNAKNMGIFQSLGELIAASGLVGIAFGHRFYSGAHLVEASGDVRDLLRYARENAATLGIDPDRLALWAFSGGGPFVSTALREGPEYVRALVAYYALLDLQVRPPGLEPGSAQDIGDDMRRAYSPVYHLATSGRVPPPMLIARAGQDHPWLNGSIDRFVAKALETNAPIEVWNHPEGRHGFDILDDEPRTHAILKRTLAFLKEVLL